MLPRAGSSKNLCNLSLETIGYCAEFIDLAIIFNTWRTVGHNQSACRQKGTFANKNKK